jgi:hypothetical protein
MKLFFLILLSLPILSYSQIKIDLREKSVNDLSGDIYYQNANTPLDGYKISQAYSENDRYYEEYTHLFNIGSPTILTYKNQTKLITANYAGDLTFYDLPTGRIEKYIPFVKLGIAMLNTTGSNKNSIITSLSLTDNEQYLVIKTFNFNGTTDKFIDYYILDLNNIQSTTSSRLTGLYSLYSFPKMELLNETKILNTNPKFFQEKAISKIQELSSSMKKFKMNKRFDGIYFTANNFVPLKFINLGDKTYFDAIDFFTNSQGRFKRNTTIKNISDFTETVSNNYLLNDIIQNSKGTFALFGTSYGSKSNAVLTKIDDLLNNVDGLYDKAISDINTYFKANLIVNNSKIVEYKKDKLYLKHEDNKYYFVSPWLDQTNKCDKPLNIWGNSYEWKYYKTVTEINNLNLKFPILFDNNTIGKYCFMGWEENKLSIYNLSLSQINNFENPLTENQLLFQNTLANKIDFNTLLPQNNNSESVVDKQPSKDIGERSCEVCAGTGIVPDKVRNGYIITFQRNPLTGGPVKCFNCNGSGKYTLVSGDYEKKKIIQYDKWSLKAVNVCNTNKIIIVFETNKRTFFQESRGGYLTKGELASNEKLIYSFIIDKNGKVILSNNTDLSTTEKCNDYSPIFIEH